MAIAKVLEDGATNGDLEWRIAFCGTHPMTMDDESNKWSRQTRTTGAIIGLSSIDRQKLFAYCCLSLGNEMMCRLSLIVVSSFSARVCDFSHIHRSSSSSVWMIRLKGNRTRYSWSYRYVSTVVSTCTRYMFSIRYVGYYSVGSTRRD